MSAAPPLTSWLDDDDLDLAVQTRRRALDRVAPLAVGIDREQVFSRALWDELVSLGMVCLAIPESHGGLGSTTLQHLVALEQISYASGVAGLYSGTTVQVARALIAHAAPATIERWLPRLVSGEAPASWAFTEPDTGSDPRQLRTKARRTDVGWVLEGAKTFISYAGEACVALVFAVADEGVTAFAVDTAQPGWRVGPSTRVMAFGGTAASPVHLDAVHVAADGVVGSPGSGFSVMLEGEALGKARVSAINIGIAQRALDEAATYARERRHRGQPIGEKFATIQSLLAEMQASTLAARALLHDVARRIDDGHDAAALTAAARLVSGRTAREVTSAALQVCGAYGLSTEMVVERLYREAKFFEVAQGSAELQRVVLGRSVLEQRPGVADR